jgi:thiamine-monophosphate kinase
MTGPVRENPLLAHLARALGSPLPLGVLVGPGDDCAVLAPAHVPLLLTTDQLIEGRHFALNADPATPIDPATPGLLTLEQVARKAVARSVSDIAAMGGTPAWSLGTGALPATTSAQDARTLTDALHHFARRWGCPMVGGDIAITTGPMVLTVTVGGVPHPRRGPVLRSTARVGDVICVTGALGGSLASGHHALFTPRIREAQGLCTLLQSALHAMIDLSDGLGLDAARLARASGVQVELDAAAVPISPSAMNVVPARGLARSVGPPQANSSPGLTAALAAALSDGEDYELLLAVDPSHPLPAFCPGTSTPLTPIGRVVGMGTQPADCLLRTPGGLVDVGELGFEHAGE